MNDAQERAMLRAEQARLVLSSDAYKEAWKALHDDLMAALLDCPQDDDKARYNAWQAVRIARRLNGALAGMIETGESAQAALNREADKQQRMANRTIRVV